MSEIIPFTLEEAKEFYFKCKFDMKCMLDDKENYARFHHNPVVTDSVIEEWMCEHIESTIASWRTMGEQDVAYSYRDIILLIDRSVTYGKYIPEMLAFLDVVKEYDELPRLIVAEGFVNFKGIASGYAMFCGFGNYVDEIECRVKRLLEHSSDSKYFSRFESACEKLEEKKNFVCSDSFREECKQYHSLYFGNKVN